MDAVVNGARPTFWVRWLYQPQRVWIRKVAFQVHLWSGLCVGVYVFLVSITGSVLVYRNELMFRAKTARSFAVISSLADLHDNLFAGARGRQVNGAGAMAIVVLAMTGAIVWWPGIKTWRRCLTLPRGIGWRRTTWHLHSLIGFWSLAFTLLFAVSGLYLCFPDVFQAFADRFDPAPPDAPLRISDQIIYWVAYLHFGRINGIGIPCRGPGWCDQGTKAVWALFGLAPAVMFVTGGVMWWTRVVRPRRGRPESRIPDPIACSLEAGTEAAVPVQGARVRPRRDDNIGNGSEGDAGGS